MFKPNPYLDFQADQIRLRVKECQLTKSYVNYLNLKNLDNNYIFYLIEDYKLYEKYVIYLNQTYNLSVNQILYVNYNKITVLSLYIYDKKIMF